MAVTTQFFNNFIKDVGLKRVNLSTDVFKAILVNSYAFDGTHEQKAQISGEPVTGYGYTAGGEILANTDWDFDVVNGFTRFDGDDITWQAAGGDIGPITGAVIYNSTITDPNTNRLMCYVDFGETVTISQDSEFKLTFHSDGVFSITPNA